MSALRIDEAGSSLLPTLTAKANLFSPYMQRWPAHRALLPTLVSHDCRTPAEREREGGPTLRALLPTLCARDAKGIGPKHTQGGQDLPRTLGGNLSATWCRWYLGFPPGWLDALDESRFASLATRSFRSARRSSAG
jgi:hypothetical protein